MKCKTFTAGDIAGLPDHFADVIVIGRNEWECMGYSRSGKTVKFARLVPADGMRLRQISIYVQPDRVVRLVSTPSRGAEADAANGKKVGG